MNLFAVRSNKKPLIWLVCFALLFSTGAFNYGNTSRTPLRHFKQTELTLKTSPQKTEKKSQYFFSAIIVLPVIGFTNDLSFRTRIFWHSNTDLLIWKMCRKHLLSRTIKIAHTTLAYTTDEDLQLLKG